MCYLVTASHEINPVIAMFPPLCARGNKAEKSILVEGKSTKVKKWNLFDKVRFYFFG